MWDGGVKTTDVVTYVNGMVPISTAVTTYWVVLKMVIGMCPRVSLQLGIKICSSDQNLNLGPPAHCAIALPSELAWLHDYENHYTYLPVTAVQKVFC